jgi:hypothetical protein
VVVVGGWWLVVVAYQYPIASSTRICFRHSLTVEGEDNIDLVAVDHTDGVSASAVILTDSTADGNNNNNTATCTDGDDDQEEEDEHVYELGGAGRGIMSDGVLNVMCVATKSSVKMARVRKAVPSSDGDVVYPHAVGTDADERDDGGNDDDDDNVRDLGNVTDPAVLAPEEVAVNLIAAGESEEGAAATVAKEVYNLQGADECEYDCRTTDTDPTHNVLGVDSEETSSI